MRVSEGRSKLVWILPSVSILDRRSNIRRNDPRFQKLLKDNDYDTINRSATKETLSEAKDTSMQEMIQRAQAFGANAIVGIDIDYETVGANGSMLMVATSGTAVVI